MRGANWQRPPPDDGSFPYSGFDPWVVNCVLREAGRGRACHRSRAMPMTTVPFRFYAVAAVMAMALATSKSFGHDVAGLLVQKTLPAPIQKELEKRQSARLQLAREGKVSDSSAARLASRQPQVKRSATTGNLESFEGLAKLSARWPQESTLSICFIDGLQQGQSAAFEVMTEVASFTNLKISKTSCSNSKIRVSFRSSGYSSYVGTDALLIPRGYPTMTLDNLDLQTPLSEISKGIIRHEFMHALGALHEHQHPDSRCESELHWDQIQEEFHWTKEQMDTNFRKMFEREYIFTSPYDVKSVMHYQLAPRYLQGGKQAKCYLAMTNNVLSDGDKSLLATLYPR
jgi:hypothetical protein